MTNLPLLAAMLMQALSPMEGQVHAFGEAAALRVTVVNPYEAPHRFSMEAFGEDWAPLTDVAPRSILIGPGDSAVVTLFVPARETQRRTVRLCATSGALARQGYAIRGQVCGKYVVSRLHS
ncbi:hypothetical protein [Parvularcula dongshanensis]|uniref:Pili assembly chaperone N-terminal domain-containing protein n=1 Tax=Parvularcula dongshanensis TaxID=1173995 RepID=A0A840I1J0_9PROT|nr:hypothetical protein [Parvularcula dongshanensis]MBB4657940.1 hypothetical protein [Parvularcula dongshanensis]